MAKDYYSGGKRRVSDTRTMGRDRIPSPTEKRLKVGDATFPKDADDALSGALVQRGVIKPRQPKALSTIRKHISDNTPELFERVKRAGEKPLDAANALRGRMGRRLIPESFTLSSSVKGRSGFGTLARGSRVTVSGVTTKDGKLTWVIKGKTAGGRTIQHDVEDERISRLF